METIERMSQYQSTIASAVEQQSATTSEMARSVDEVVRRTMNVVEAMAMLETGVNKTAKGLDDTRASALSLAEMASALRDVMERFDLASPGKPAKNRPPLSGQPDDDVRARPGIICTLSSPKSEKQGGRRCSRFRLSVSDDRCRVGRTGLERVRHGLV